MKRCFYLFLTCVYILLCCACNSSDSATFDGAWYSADNAYLYQFSDGEIFCENSYITLDDGKQITGTYDEHDGYIDAYIIGVGGFEDAKPLYLIKEDGCDALCDTADGDGRIYFYKDQVIAERIATEKQAEFEKWQEGTASETMEPFDPSDVITVSYDSIVAGEHTNEIVGIEAIVSNFTYDELLESYSFDLWYWSDKENQYIKDEGCLIFESDYSPKAIEPLSTFEDGDKIRMILKVYQDNSFGPSGYIWSELLQEGNLSDYGIIISGEEDSAEKDLMNSNEDDENYVYITDNGAKYHTATCRTLSKSSNKILYTDAIARGYTPCRICNPIS